MYHSLWANWSWKDVHHDGSNQEARGQYQVSGSLTKHIPCCVHGHSVVVRQQGVFQFYVLCHRSMKELFKICSERTKVKYTMKVSDVSIHCCSTSAL